MRSQWWRAGRWTALLLACGAPAWVRAVQGQPAAAPSSTTRPNVLLIVVDDLNAELAYSPQLVRTPNIERLAAMGRRFDRAYCQLPLCSPSRTSLLSGKRPETTRVLDNLTPPRSLLPDVTMLPQFFRRNGYHAATVGKIYHGPFHDAASWDEALATGIAVPEPEEGDEEGDASTRRRARSTAPRPTDRDDALEPDGAAVRAAAAFLRRKHDKPFFLGVGLRRPHGYAQGVPKKYWDLYDPAQLQLPDIRAGSGSGVPPIARKQTMRAPPSDEPGRRASLHAYYAAVSFMDAQLGVLLDALQETARRQDTVVLLVSDHGYHLGDHGLWGKRSLFENAARVPLLIAGPGVREPGRPAPNVVEMLDVYPTLVDLCGLPQPTGLEGRSLRPILEQPAASVHEGAFTMIPAGRSVRTVRWRYTEWSAGRAAELYDHDNDPGELLNRVKDREYAQTVATLRQLLRTHGRDEAPSTPK
jgi:uncharacterized sulfatase